MSMLGTKKGRILKELLSGPKMMTDLKSVISSYDVLRYNLLELQTEGYISKKENREDKRRFLISLTEKGRRVAEQLRKAEEIANSPNVELAGRELDLSLTEEEAEMANHLKRLFHSNVLDDHITVEEVKPGNPPRIFNIYVKRNGNGEFRLWCEHDDSYDCWHVKSAWTYPHVQKMMMHYKGRIKVCKSCGFENPEIADYCMKCGAKIE